MNMNCPQCGARTQVREKRGPFRDRRCTNFQCGMDFTTREHLLPQLADQKLCARTCAARIGLAQRTEAAKAWASRDLSQAGKSPAPATGRCGNADGSSGQRVEAMIPRR